MTGPSFPPAGDTVRQKAVRSQVDAQIGVVHGDVSFYKMTGGESPAEKFRVGCNYLAGNMPRQAEKLIREAFMAGHRSTQVSYYWALAVLSDRSFDHLTDEEFDQITAAFDEVHEHAPDEWLVALRVVAELVESLTRQEEQPLVDPAEFDDALGHFANLPEARRDEVRRHLDMILAGELQDRLEAQHAAEVAAKRMGERRQERVWKFFQPQPEPPRLLDPPEVQSRQEDMAVTAGGAALLLLCLYFGSGLLLGESAFLFVLSLLCYFGGAYATVRYGFPRLAEQVRTSWVQARFRGDRWFRLAAIADRTPEVVAPARATFADAVARRVVQWFRFERHPANGRAVSVWMQESKGIRASLSREIVEQYGERSPLPRVESLDWLIRWHADTLFDRWESGKFRDNRGPVALTRDEAVGSVAGPAALGLSVLLTGVNAVGASAVTGFLTAVVWAVGTAAVWGGAAQLYRKSSLATWLADQMQERKLAEDKAHADWYAALEDRPTDPEIAAWLDHDKAFIRALAMKHHRLANRDLIAHVVLAGPSPTARYAARVLYGPLRYSHYTVQVFLLTEGGVREVAVDLHLPTGAISNERRRNFGYHAITSATVSEAGVQIDGMTADGMTVDGGRHDDADEPDDTRSSAGGDKLVFSQEFQLTLNNLEAVRLVVANIDEGLVDRVLEDPRHLFELARDTSGVTPALQILEAIAAETSDWVRQERLRRHRRIRDYRRRRETTAIEAGRPTGPPDVPAPRIADGSVVRELK